MLSPNYRLKLEGICERIARHQEVSLEEIIWCEKLAAVNRSAATILRQARRRSENPEMRDGSLDDFLNQMDIGNLGFEGRGIKGFQDPDDVADYFRNDRRKDWRD